MQAPRSPVGSGDTLVYTLTLVNAGSTTAYGVILTDTLPAGVTYLFDVLAVRS